MYLLWRKSIYRIRYSILNVDKKNIESLPWPPVWITGNYSKALFGMYIRNLLCTWHYCNPFDSRICCYCSSNAEDEEEVVIVVVFWTLRLLVIVLNSTCLGECEDSKLSKLVFLVPEAGGSNFCTLLHAPSVLTRLLTFSTIQPIQKIRTKKMYTN